MKNIYILTVFVFLIISTNIYSQDFYDLETIQTIEITFAESNWDALLDAQYSEDGDYIMAQSVTINGEVFDSVGVKYKGNSSYRADQVKNPWHIELDTYKDHEYDGYTDIKLANGYNDPSFLRDVLGFYIIRKYMDAPLSNFANLYVNGTLIGLYTNTESISKKFAKSRFGSNDNAYFDCSPPDGAPTQSGNYPNLVYLGQDSTDYYDAYEMKSDYGWRELIDLCDTLSYNISDIENILDVDRALWMLAFDNAIVNLDSYIGIFSQNYYLYRSEYQQFLPIVWDLNESFGVFSQTGSSTLNTTSSKQQMSHLLHSSDSNFPLVKQLLSIPMYKRMYLAHYKTMLLENFDNGEYYDTALTFQSLIDASVRADVNKFFTYNDFLNNLTSDIISGFGPQSMTFPGITNLMNGRSSYLLALSDFTETAPTISSIALSDESPAVNETIAISASVADGNAVYLGYRNETIAPFSLVEMYDDGAHGDGSANDGTYGTYLEINNSEVQYYIYAENDNAGQFSPERAQYEFYTIATSSDPLAIELVINEFMASNETTVTDQDGEYDDWIELYNNSDEDISLNGYFLSDDGNDLSLWAFPDTTISAKGYLIVWADKDEDQAGLHADLKISSSGETIYLSGSDTTIIDEVSFGEQTDDISTGRYPNGTGSFVQMSPTFSAENNDGITGIPDDQISELPDQFNLSQNYPNPFNPTTNISFKLPSSNFTSLKIYNITGQQVATLVNKQLSAGTYVMQWDAKNMPSGIYFYMLTSGSLSETKRMILMK
ncbi:MAG: CotH kinase family protein [Calditrichaceae bacterium]